MGGGDPAEDFDAFKAGLKEGISAEKAALEHAFTGHVAKKCGFAKVAVIQNDGKKVVLELRE